MSMMIDSEKDVSHLAVCAYFAPEIAAALAMESLEVELVPFHGRCDERPHGCHCPRPADTGAPLLCGGCAGTPSDAILSFDWCFELLLGPTDLSSLLSQGCHLLTPCMLDTWTENVEAWGFSPEAAREYFGESVSRFIVLDAGVQPISTDVLSEITSYTGCPVEVLPLSLDYLRLMLRHALELIARQNERKELQTKLTFSQGLNSDLGMAYDLLARMQPFPDEAAAVTGLLELFVALFAPRAVHYLPVAGALGVGRSLPEGAVLGNELAARSWAKEGDYGPLEEDGFHILVHKDQEVLGRVLVEGLVFPERREDYLRLATFVTPVLALFILNGRIHESLRTAEAVRREKNVLRAVLDAVPVWITYLDRDGRIVVDNQQQATLFGLPAPQGRNEASWETLTPLLLEEHRALLARCLAGETVPFARELTEIPGRKPFVSGTYVPVRQEDGQVVGAIVAISDISEPMRKEREQRDREAIYQVIFNGSRDGILIADTVNRHFHHANPAICELLGYRTEELMQMGVEDIHPLAEMPNVRAAFARSLRGEVQEPVELPVQRKDGSIFPAEISSTPIQLGDQAYMVGIFRDISARKEAERRLRLNAAVFNNALEGITIADPNGTILDVNDGFTAITGFTREEALGGNSRMHQSGLHDAAFYSSIWQEIKTHGHWGGEIWNRHKNGELYAEWLNITTVRDDHGEVVNYIGVFTDITFAKQHEKQLERTAHYDALTGIPNRLLLADRMAQAIAQDKREQKMLGVCYLDLDGFKPVNDTMGHQAGDHVLIEIARRIGHILREGDTVARLGGDEFVVLPPSLNHVEECIATVKRLHETIAQPICIQDQSFSLTASIGVSIFPDDDNDSDVLLRYADQAMYIAKQSGKNRYHFFDLTHDQ
jgi:diguanylate cyclase (GGDEF)-like protein/PAS domain S-box-containing protein